MPEASGALHARSVGYIIDANWTIYCVKAVVGCFKADIGGMLSGAPALPAAVLGIAVLVSLMA